ncbi:hypothetical protein [Bacillus tuaregi]|uniref:hypothetical protein n=1 Tax=Bacillus tuaregi TaxID=1816695 RepID=UPI0008F88B90|nr:hypothetical protein [Bacillus tuaregi]
MEKIQDAIYNWLTIKVVIEERPDDKAAAETEEMFRSILMEELGLSEIEVKKENGFYQISYCLEGEQRSTRFPQELIEVMLNQINESPDRYQNYPD